MSLKKMLLLEALKGALFAVVIILGSAAIGIDFSFKLFWFVVAMGFLDRMLDLALPTHT